VGAKFTRVQFTPDLLPSDILGVSVFNQRDQTFEFREGPVFTSILLADEVNRASPRTQSALLEVMAEGQVSVEGRTHAMDPLFFVIATQNPVEFRGTYPLPEAQMDRFALCLSLGYVDADTEVAVLSAQDAGHPLERIGAVAAREEVLALKAAVRACASPTSSSTTWSSSCAARARRPRWCSAAGRAPRSRSRTRRARSRSSTARPSCAPSTCRSSPWPRSRTAWCSIRRRASRACPRRRWSPTCCGR
jgi:MoxR-like ATPase